MSRSYTVSLAGPAPWGFRLQGGKDFSMPLTISRLTDGGKAAKANVAVGDVVLSIDGIATNGMTHLEAQNKIKACSGVLNLTLQKASNVPKVAEVPKEVPQEIIKPVPIAHPAPPTASTNAAPGAAYNKTARPFGGGGGSGGASPFSSSPKVASIPSASSAFTPAAPANAPPPPAHAPPPQQSQPQPPFPIGPGAAASRVSATPSSAPKPSTGRAPFPPSSAPARGVTPPSIPVPPQPSVYNTPINLYSNENACEVAIGQRRGLLEGQVGTEQLNGGPQSILKVPRKPNVDTDIGFYHVPSHGDASKKRLMEDTEDWHPRSGTSQSRSFRILAQITGTEREQAKENDAGKKVTKVNPEVVGPSEKPEELHANAHVTSPMKTMTKGPAGGGVPRNGTSAQAPPLKPATWQMGGPAGSGLPKVGAQKANATPSFGRLSNSAPKGPVSERPAPQPHPKDQDSLVQRAEHIPAGTRTPMCGHCDKVIRGPFLVAMGKSWHPEEFTCTHCHTSLAEVGFVEERGTVHCEHCYEEFFAPTCARCQQKVLGEVINALKQTWHVHCFLCVSCHQPIRNNTFHLEDGEPYCEKDYYNLFGTTCHGCDFPIEAGDKFLEALGFTWHDTCFVCAVCSTSLEGQAFFSKKDKPLCKKHAHTVKI